MLVAIGAVIAFAIIVGIYVPHLWLTQRTADDWEASTTGSSWRRR